MSYRFLEHTSDIMFEVKSGSIDELFIEAAKAMNNIVLGKIKVLETFEKRIKIKGDSLEDLLYQFLEEFLFLLDSEERVFNRVEIIRLDQKTNVLEAILYGDDAKKYHFTNDAKAVTYQNFKIKKEGNFYKVKITIDV